MPAELFMRVNEVAEVMGVSEPYAYKIIRRLNKELKKTGCISRKFKASKWSQWVQSEKEVLANVMKRHGVEWLQLGSKREHLSVLDYKKEQRTKEIAELESKLADKKDEFEVYQDRISNYSKGEQVIEELAKKLDTEPDYQL